MTFKADEGENVIHSKTANISITNDDINEAIEQYFVVTIDVERAENESTIVITRTSSLCTIVDDDRKLHNNNLFSHPVLVINSEI